MENDAGIPGCDKIRQLIIGGTAVAKYIPDREIGDMDVMISDHDRGKVEEILKQCLPELTEGNRWRNVRGKRLDVFIESPSKFDETYARGHPETNLIRTMHCKDLILFLEQALCCPRPRKCSEDEKDQDARKRKKVKNDLSNLRQYAKSSSC